MKTQHWALLAAAAFLYYMTTQRKNVAIVPALPPFDQNTSPTYDETGFVAPKFPHTPTPSYAMDKVNVFTKISTYDFTDASLNGYEGGMNWPARDNIFG
jgi:hypothetical protein